MHLLVPGAYRRLNVIVIGTTVQQVSMHLLVPGAYRQAGLPEGDLQKVSSQCTFWCRVLTDPLHLFAGPRRKPVSMHLLVPGAYRPCPLPPSSLGRAVSMHLLVPGAYRLDEAFPRTPTVTAASQCTFWCRVLTDCRLCKPRRSTVYSTVIATGDPCTLTHR